MFWSTGSKVVACGLNSCGLQALQHKLSSVAHKLSCPTPCVIFPDQGSNTCLPHWQADSLPLSHCGSPSSCFSTQLKCPFWEKPSLAPDIKWVSLSFTIVSQVAQMVKNPPAMPETCAQSLGWEDPLEKGMATHSIILSWRIPWTEEPGGLRFMGLQTLGHHWSTFTLTNSLIPSVWVSFSHEDIAPWGNEPTLFDTAVSLAPGTESDTYKAVRIYLLNK